MRKAVILHGITDKEEYFEMDFPSLSNAHWSPWLQQKFLRAGVFCQTLEMPTPYAPVYEEWVETFEQLSLNDDSIVVGHSAGCGFILKWLHHNRNRHFKKVVLVAPYLDPEKEQGDFLQLDLDPSIQDQINEIHLLSSSNDMNSIQQTTEKVIKIYPKIKLHQFNDMGHFDFEYTGPTFPDLWEIAKPKE